MPVICKDQTHTHDRWLVQVKHQVSTWSHSWYFHTFHDLRASPVLQERWPAGKIGEFNTFNAELVVQCLMEEPKPWPSWEPGLLNDQLAWAPENYEVALEYARRLRMYGRFAHDLTKPLTVRLVRDQLAHLVEEYPL